MPLILTSVCFYSGLISTKICRRKYSVKEASCKLQQNTKRSTDCNGHKWKMQHRGIGTFLIWGSLEFGDLLSKNNQRACNCGSVHLCICMGKWAINYGLAKNNQRACNCGSVRLCICIGKRAINYGAFQSSIDFEKPWVSFPGTIERKIIIDIQIKMHIKAIILQFTKFRVRWKPFTSSIYFDKHCILFPRITE